MTKLLSYETFTFLLFILYVFSVGYIVTVNTKNQFINDAMTFIQNSLFLFVIAIWICISKSIRPMMGIIICNSIASGAIALIHNQYIYGRLSLSIKDNPNNLAYIMLVGILALLVLFSVSKIRSFWFYFLIILFNNYIILLTGSRKNLIISLVCICLFFLFQKNQMRKMIIYIMFSPVVALIVWYGYSEIYLNSKMIRDATESDSLREYMYRRAIEIFYEYPFFGVGYNGYKTISGVGTYSHSVYMELLSTTGLIGFLLYCSIYLVLINKFVRQLFLKKLPFSEKKEIFQIFLMLISLIVLGFAVVHTHSIISNILMGIVIGYVLLTREKTRRVADAK